jgi:hypothetical protein
VSELGNLGIWKFGNVAVWVFGERVTYTYAGAILDALASHGLQPRTETPPAVLRDALSDLYRYEIRRLKQRLLRGEFPKQDYSRHVIELRRKYWLLSVPVRTWTRQDS